jgi:hypothetical protein
MLLSVILQQSPADTTNYMWLGFGIIFGVMILHVVSMYNRANRLKKDLAFLEELED